MSVECEPTVYLGGPIRDAADSGATWRTGVSESEPVETIDPLDKYEPGDDQQPDAHEIVDADLSMIDAADALLVRYDGEETWGTPMEVRHACMAETPVFLAWLADGELSPWAEHHATAARGTLRDAITALIDWWEDGKLRSQVETVGEEVSPYDAADDVDAAYKTREDDGAAERAEQDGDTLAGAVAEDLAALLTQSRDTHGDAVENQQHIAEGWNWLLRDKLEPDRSITGADVARAMELVKISRLTVGEYDIDHDRDVAGYAAIAAACEVVDGGADRDELREHTNWSQEVR